MTSSMTPPRDRPTDPAGPMSDHEILLDVAEQLGALAVTVRRLELDLAIQLKELGAALFRIEANTDALQEALGDHAGRLSRLEQNQHNGSAPPAGLETE